MENLLIAVPSNNPGGLEAGMSQHFGHCDLYTLLEISDKEIKSVTTLENPPHQQGGCLAPVQKLAERKVDALLAGGMGMRPLAGFRQAGIAVYQAGDQLSVQAAVKAFLEGRLRPFSQDHTCKGHGGHCS